MTVSHSELEWEHFSAPVSWKRRRDENEMKKHIKRLLGSNNDIINENSKINLMRVSDTPHHVPFAYLTSKVTELSPHCNLLLSSARNQLGWRIVSCCEVVLGINGKRFTSCYQLPAISSACIECLHLRFSISGAPSTSLKLLAIVKFLMELQCILCFQFATYKFGEWEMFQSPMWLCWDDNFLPTPLKTTHSNPPRHKQPKAWFNSPLFDVWATVEWLTEFNLKCIFKCSPSRDKLIRLTGSCLGWPRESFRLELFIEIWISIKSFEIE